MIFRGSFRRLRAARGYAAIVLLTLALGVGMNSAVFSVVRTLLLDALPYPQAHRLLSLAEQGTPEDQRPVTVSYGTFADWRAQARSFASMAAYTGWSPTAMTPGGAERMVGMRVTHEFFATLGVSPAMGRDFSADDDRWDARDAAVIVDHGYWQAELGGDPAVIGRSIELSGRPATIVGVLPRDFEPLGFQNDGRPPRLWAPLGYELDKPFACRTCQHLRAVARITDGVTPEQASAELHGIQQRLAADHPADYPPTATVLAQTLNEALVGSLSRKLWLLFAAATLVMAIVCANVAGMSSARAIARQRELALHAAMGAGRSALLGQVLGESLLLSLCGSALGLLLGAGGLELFRALAPDAIPRMSGIEVDAGIVAYTVGLAVVAGLLAGALPAWIAARSDPLLALRHGTGGALGSQPRVQRWLVGAQVCAAVVVATGGALLLRSFDQLADVDPGFDAAGVVTASTQLGARHPDPASRRAAQAELLGRLHASPGVEAAAITTTLPLAGFDRSGFHRRDVPMPSAQAPSTDVYRVSDGYFESMRVPLLAGRLFTPADRADSAGVAIVSRTLAESFWPGEDAVGKQVQLGGLNPDAPWLTVVGVVGDVRQYGLDQPPTPQTYVPTSQSTPASFHLVLRSDLSPAAASAVLRESMRGIDPAMPVYDIAPLDASIAESLAPRRLALWLLGSFSVLGTLLAAVGVYGVMAQSLERRRREIGLRTALGAGGSRLLAWALGLGAAPVLGGAAAGVAVALLAGRSLGDSLVGVGVDDPRALGWALFGVLACAAAATLLPAVRAVRAPPGELLHEQ